MPTPDQVFNLRAVQGINLVEDARITDQGSWNETQNLYGRNPGVLAKRPGTAIYVQGRSGGIKPGDTLAGTDFDPPVLGGNAGPGETVVLPPGSLFDDNFRVATGGDQTLIGHGGIRPGGLLSPLLASRLPINPSFLNVTPIRVNGLFRLYMDQGKKRFWIIAYDMPAGMGDQLAYVDDEDTTPVIKLIVTPKNISPCYGALFQFISFRYKSADAVDDTQAYWAIGTNGFSLPFVLKDGSSFSTSTDVAVTGLNVVRSDQFEATIPDSTPRIAAVQALAVYNGSIVYGGYNMVTPSTGAKTEFGNFIAFSDAGEPSKLATSNSLVSSIRIGDSLSEPVTAMSVNSIGTDSVGVKGQLVVFTDRRVVLFDGLPPVSGNPEGVNFHSVAMKDVGCNAPRSVVRTPQGVAFLGTDGLVYLIPAFGSSGPVPIGRAVEPLLNHMLPRQHRYAAAYYHEGFYKLSFVDAHRSRGGGGSGAKSTGTLTTSIPSKQIWADFRYLDPSAQDLGVRWYGRMINLWHGVFETALAAEDRGRVLAGSSYNGDLFELEREDLFTDPKPTQFISAAVPDPMPIKIEALTGPFDLGDAHIDKSVTAVSLGIGTSQAVEIDSNIIVSGEVNCTEAGEKFTRIVRPCGGILGATAVYAAANVLKLGTSKLQPRDSHSLITERPSSRRRGRLFRFRFLEKPAFFISNTTNKLDFKEAGTTRVATLTVSYYTATDLATEVARAMNAAVSASYAAITCTYNAGTDKFTLSGTSVFQLLWGTGANVAIDCNERLGFLAVDSTAATSYTSNTEPKPGGGTGRLFFSDLSFRAIVATRRI